MEVAMVEAVLVSRYGRIQRDLETDEIWSEKSEVFINMKPRFRAEWVVVREELLILASCCIGL